MQKQSTTPIGKALPAKLLGLSMAGFLAASLVWADHPAPPAKELTPLAVDLKRYLGSWYQVALYPNKFQSQCVKDTTATYRSLPDGSLEVVNACRLQNGEMTQATGQARFHHDSAVPATPDAPRVAKLQVRFAPSWLSWLPLVWGDYWVIDLANDYRWAVVSEPKRQFLWVLSRSPQLADADIASIRRFLQTQGFDLARLQMHAHGSAAAPSSATSAPVAAGSAPASAASR